MSIVRQPESISENISTIAFHLRFPYGAEKPNLTLQNIDNSKFYDNISDLEDDQVQQKFCYVKLTYSPNIFETVLPYHVNTDISKLQLDIPNNSLKLICKKKDEDENHTAYAKPDKKTITEIREKAIKCEELQTKHGLKIQKQKKDKTKKLATGAAMTMDGERRQNIEIIKQEEIAKSFAGKNNEDNRNLDLDQDDDQDDIEKIHSAADQAIDRAIRARQQKAQMMNKIKQFEKAKKSIPIRGTGNGDSTLEVDLTHRIFPTASRQQYVEQEKEWLAKQSQFRKRIEVNNPDLMDHEKDPEWLKNKGIKLFKAGDFISATHAFSMALSITPSDPNLYLNRAASYLKSDHCHKAISDCQQVIELLTPACESNKTQRAKAFARRGAAFTNIGMYARAMDDTKHAYDLTRDPKLQEDLRFIEAQMKKLPEAQA